MLTYNIHTLLRYFAKEFQAIIGCAFNFKICLKTRYPWTRSQTGPPALPILSLVLGWSSWDLTGEISSAVLGGGGGFLIFDPVKTCEISKSDIVFGGGEKWERVVLTLIPTYAIHTSLFQLQLAPLR